VSTELAVSDTPTGVASSEPPFALDEQGDPYIQIEAAYRRHANQRATEQYESWRRERQERGQNLLDQARRGWAAVHGWDRIESQEQWERLRDEAVENWESGVTLLELLGGTRYLEPERAALCLTLWNDFLVSYRPTGPAEYLVIAMAVLSFDHFLRINGIIQNLEIRLENEFFSVAPLTATIAPHAYSRTSDDLTISQVADQLRLQMLPWLDRLNRLVIRNLRALRELKGGPLSLTVTNVGQLNLAQQQTNRVESAKRRGRGGTKRTGTAPRSGEA
jgi:hypothetical protein